MGAQLIPFPESARSTFAEAWALIPSTMKTRSVSRAKLAPLWNDAAKRVGGHDVLLAALRAYLVGDKDLPKSGGPALDRWLKWEKYDHWLPGENSVVSEGSVGNSHTSDRPRFPEPNIRAAVQAHLGLAWVISYLDRCELAEGANGPVLVVSSATAMQRIREQAKALKAAGLYGMRMKAG